MALRYPELRKEGACRIALPERSKAISKLNNSFGVFRTSEKEKMEEARVTKINL